MTLGTNDVRVFLAQPDRILGWPDVERILSPDDRTHVARFRFERDRRLARASRAFQRCALSACAPVEPSAWRFVNGGNGKPSIAAPARFVTLSFNVSNAHGLVACAVSTGRAVGVDVESIRTEVPYDVVERWWSRRERDALASLAPTDRPRRFAETWTAKEAYLKARGLGLSVDLTAIGVIVTSDDSRLDLDPALADPGAWQLAVWLPSPSHAAAVCVRTDGSRVRITRQWLDDPSPSMRDSG